MTTEHVNTADTKRCEKMVNAVLNARTDARFGQIIGAPGTGKTHVSKWLADKFGGVRVCASADAKPVGLMMTIAKALELPVDRSLGVDALLDMVSPVSKDRLIVVDEANHLNWRCLETLRFLPDECSAAVVVLGTPLLDETFKDGRTKVYLDQLRRRIGGKRVVLSYLTTVEQIAECIIGPRFGKVTKATAKRFLTASRGDWGTGLELADTCQRILDQSEGATLDEGTVVAASEFLAA